MPGYIKQALLQFSHPLPACPEHSLHAWQKLKYGAKIQYADPPTTALCLDAADTKCIQEVVGVLLYYAHTIDSTLLTTLGTIATQHAKGTQATMEAITQLLNYCAMHPVATVCYHASDMILWIHSDASYLTTPIDHLQAAGYHFLSTMPSAIPLATADPPPDNGPIDVLCQIMKPVLASAAKAKSGALFLTAKHACPLCVALHKLGHDQPSTPIQTDNTTTTSIANDTIKQKQSKSINMHFYWICNRIHQGQYHIFWQPGITNKVNYFTKHHPNSHHQNMQPAYLHASTNALNVSNLMTMTIAPVRVCLWPATRPGQ